MITNANYELIRQWLKELCGVEIGDNRYTMVQSRLAKRVIALELADINAYVRHLRKLDCRLRGEWRHFLDILTTHETYFFREAQHFDFLKQFIFPEYQGRQVKMLSAACSSGEEAYSIAFESAANLPDDTQWRVYGTDIAESSIKQAKKGLYNDLRTKLIPEHYRKNYLLKGVDDMDGYCLVKKEIKAHVEFFVGNILSRISRGPFDVIFCRNVMIYFDMETRQSLISNLMNHLNPGGYLIISQTEQLRNYVTKESLVSTSIARKIEHE